MGAMKGGKKGKSMVQWGGGRKGKKGESSRMMKNRTILENSKSNDQP